MPTVTPAPPPPSRTSTEIQNAATAQRARFWGASGGRAMTDLSGGDVEQPNVVSRLLGNTGR
jgi:hypothetical protein